jgi:ATP-dependent RNA helicase SUPV3L1/SUV3
MMSILGCSPDELTHVLTALGFHADRRLVPAVSAPAVLAPAEAKGDAPAAAQAPPVVCDIPVDATGVDGEIAAVVVAETAAVDSATVGAGVVAEATAAAPELASAAVPEEPKYEDVWRPRRQHYRGQGERTQGERPAAERGPRAPRTGDRAPRDRSRYRPSPTAAVPVDPNAPVVAGAAREGAADAVASPRPEGERGPRRDRGGQGQRGDRGADVLARGPRPDGRPAGGGRPGDFGDKRGDDRGANRGGPRPGRDRERDDRRGPKVITASPSKSSSKSVVDADSPFAKLQALRDQMVGRGKEKNT